MKQDLEILDLKFWSWLPKGIKNPKKINNFLNQRSELLDQEIIKKFEGCELEAYKCAAGVWTIGYGHTKDVQEGDKWTEFGVVVHAGGGADFGRLTKLLFLSQAQSHKKKKVTHFLFFLSVN